MRDLFRQFDGTRVFHEDSHARCATHTDHDRHRRRQSECARAGDDEHGNGVNESERYRGRGAENCPDDERDHRRGYHDGHEPTRHGIGDFLDRRPAALGFRDHVDDLRKQRIAADFFRAHHETSVLVQGRADHGVAFLFRDRHGLAGDHGFVEVAAAFGDRAIDGDFLAGTDAEQVADRDLIDRHVFFFTVAEAVGGFRGKADKGLDRLTGAGAGFRL